MYQLIPIQLNKCDARPKGNDNAAYAKHYVYDTVWTLQSMQNKRDSANKQAKEHRTGTKQQNANAKRI